jgi:hypothetical protein
MRKGDVRIPLIDILPEFIRERVNTFAECHGPNCVNVGKNLLFGPPFELAHDLGDPAFFQDIQLVADKLGPDEKLKPGDVLFYRKPDLADVKHVSVVVAPGIVFTKNGLHKGSPYLFQTKKTNEALYFKDGSFQLEVYRKKNLGCPLYLYLNGWTQHQSQ